MRKRGDKGEEIACGVLARAGYFVIARNVCVVGGEVDIVARDREGTVVFVEVKLRATLPIDHRQLLPRRKVIAMRRVARMFMAESDSREIRCDLLILIGDEIRITRAVWYKDVGGI